VCTLRGYCRVATKSVCTVCITAYPYLDFRSAHFVWSLFPRSFRYPPPPSQCWRLDIIIAVPEGCFRSWRFDSCIWEIFSFIMPSSELSHVVKSWLWDRRAVSDYHPVCRPLNLLLMRYSRTGGARCTDTPLCCGMRGVSRPLSCSYETNHVWGMSWYTVWLTLPSKEYGLIKLISWNCCQYCSVRNLQRDVFILYIA
jgi:hypothetical protein